MKKIRQVPQFTHFVSIPFVGQEHQDYFIYLQTQISQIFKKKGGHQKLSPNNSKLPHLTISMLTIPHKISQLKTQKVLQDHKQQFLQIMKDCQLTTDGIKYFTYKHKWSKSKTDLIKRIKIIYLDIKKDKQYEKVQKFLDLFIRIMLKQQILVHTQLKDMRIIYDHNRNLFICQDPHITLFRCEDLLQNTQVTQIFTQIQKIKSNRILKCDSIDIMTRWQPENPDYHQNLYKISFNKKDQQIQENQQKV